MDSMLDAASYSLLPYVLGNESCISNDLMSISNGTYTQQNGDRVSRTNLYIKGLTEDFTDQRLRDLVPDVNMVKSVKAATEDDNKCRGYGFIDFFTEESAQTALRYIQQKYDSFTIKFAKENEKDKTNLYVTNIPKTWTTKDSDKLKELFSKFGAIQSAFIMMERSSNKATGATGVGFVRFANEEDAQRALDGIKNNPQLLPGCTEPIETKFADKHSTDARRRRNANPINGTVRTTLATASSFPLIQTPGTASFAPSLYTPYNTSLYRPNAAGPAASPFSSYQLATAYPGLAAQSLLSSGFYMPSVTASTSTVVQNAAALQALAGQTNGVTDATTLSSNFGHQVFLANNLTSPGLSAVAAATAYGHQGFDYAAAAANPYSYAALHHAAEHP